MLNDVGDDPDQLPTLQHALMRTWDRRKEEGRPDKPMDLPHYEAIGGMADALSIHADEAFNELPDDRSREVAEKLRTRGLRVHVDDRSEKMNYKIREAQVQKVPYMLVVGDKEIAARGVSVRHRQAGDLGPMDVEDLGAKIARLAAERALVEESPPPTAGGVQ